MSSLQELNFVKRLRFYYSNFKKWCQAGDPPPSTQVNSLYLMVFLLIFGHIMGVMFFLALFDIACVGWFTSLFPLAFSSLITLIPSYYILWVSYHCWRKAPGYDWYIVPNF